MKNRILNIFGAFLAVFFIATACEKDEPIKLEEQLETWYISSITSTSAQLSGFVVAQGDGFTEYGVCWSTTANPTVDSNKKVADVIDGAIYHISVTGLEFLTKYYAKAYVKTSDGAYMYGAETTFTTLANIPILTIKTITFITGKTASSGGEITSDGKAEVTEKGICWSTTPAPTIENSFSTSEVAENSYNITMTGLNGKTTYYVRAYAKNKMGVGYSSELSFETHLATPSLTTDSTNSVTKTSFKVFGTVTATGGADVTERGFVYATTESPTTANNKVLGKVSTGLGSFTVDSIYNLEPGTVYYVRAYATNSAGTEYGVQKQIKTIADITKLWLPGGYQAASGYSASDWSPSTAPFIINTKEDKVLDGYIYFANNNSQFKFTTEQDWDEAYGDKTGDGILDTENDNNINVAQAGLYRITVNLSTMTYTLTKYDWRIIGDAVGGWGDGNQVDLVYNKNLKRLIATPTFVASGFKFIVNRDWQMINYGDKTLDNYLDTEGGNNITNDLGTFTVMVNFSTEVEADGVTKKPYSYAVTHWGVIGDAVGGWGSDHDMTPIGNNKWSYTGSFTVGTFKFRANDSWSGFPYPNYGDKTGDGIVDTENDNNIAVTTAGTYTLVLDMTDGSYTLTPAKSKKK